ncbi:MAG TPA: nucleotidyltransferase family protein [Nitrososphaerales archaeon]|nr:nucleotidyltransferase family protein [Nitrososphaerales archaeon]
MESVLLLPADGLDAAEKIIDSAESRGVSVRLLGGLAFKYLCPSTKEERFYRKNKDIDLAGRREDVREIMKVMESMGYKPREIFNKLSMGQRLIYYDMVNKRRVDIFLDEFAMCHKLDLRQCLLPGTYTIPITDLVMTKLQVVEMTEKEHLDLIAAFRDFDVTADDSGISGKRIARACSKDWGLYTTFAKSLAKIEAKAESLQNQDRDLVAARVGRLKKMMEEEPKSLSWRVRARIGEKAKWYDLPDSDVDQMLD